MATIHITADHTINPSAHGKPTPTVVRVFTLPDKTPIPLHFDSFWKQPSHGIEYQIYPKQHHSQTLAIAPDHKRIVMATFLRKHGRFKWLAVTPIPQQKTPWCSSRTLHASLSQQGPAWQRSAP